MALPNTDDTIVAVATAPGSGAIGIVRLSGPSSFSLAGKLFAPTSGANAATLPPRVVTHGLVQHNGETIDEALLLTFQAPHSYTGDDVIEIQSHGGPAVLRAIIDAAVSHGARLAGPGEFTLRAFMNGRMDLTQAEAVLDMVNASSDSARRNASLGLSGALTTALSEIQTDLTTAYASVQAAFDYPEEGIPPARLDEPLARAKARVAELLATAEAGRYAQNGARLALLGKPNVGKSSLLNALLGYQRSIVSNIPGTTRDYLEAPLMLGGIALTLLDTAGIRHTADEIEASGVEFSRELGQAADMRLVLLDTSEPITDDDRTVLAHTAPERTIIVLNKRDLPAVWTSVPELARFAAPVEISSVTGEGLAELRARMTQELTAGVSSTELWIGNDRHISVLERVHEHITAASQHDHDIASFELQDALRALGELTGRGDVVDETLAAIFANFCVGK